MNEKCRSRSSCFLFLVFCFLRFFFSLSPFETEWTVLSKCRATHWIRMVFFCVWDDNIHKTSSCRNSNWILLIISQAHVNIILLRLVCFLFSSHLHVIRWPVLIKRYEEMKTPRHVCSSKNISFFLFFSHFESTRLVRSIRLTIESSVLTSRLSLEPGRSWRWMRNEANQRTNERTKERIKYFVGRKCCLVATLNYWQSVIDIGMVCYPLTVPIITNWRPFIKTIQPNTVQVINSFQNIFVFVHITLIDFSTRHHNFKRSIGYGIFCAVVGTSISQKWLTIWIASWCMYW